MFNTAGVSVGLPGFASSDTGVSVAGGVGVAVAGGGVGGVSVAVAAGLGAMSAVGEPVDSGGFVDGTPVVGEAGVSGPAAGVTVSTARPAMGVGPPHALRTSSAQTASQAARKR